MNYKWICLFFLGAAFVSSTASSYDVFPDYISNEYYDDESPVEQNPIPDEKVIESINHETDNKVNEEIQMFKDKEENWKDTVKEAEPLEDYQYEDNRSKDKDDLEEDSDDDKVEPVDENASDEVDFDEPEDTLEVNEAVDSKKIDDIPENNKQDSYPFALLWGDTQEQEALSKINDDEKKLLQETQDILEEDKEQGIVFEKKIDIDAEDTLKNDDIPEDRNQDEVAEDYALLWGDKQEQAALSEIKDDEQKMLEETQAILEADKEQGIDLGKKVDKGAEIDEELLKETRRILEDTNNNFENNEDSNVMEKNNDDDDTDSTHLEESKKILVGIDNNFNDDTNIKDDDEVQANSSEDESNSDIEGGDENDDEIVNKIDADDEIANNNHEEEDTADKVLADLNSNLDKLFETIDKLQESGDDGKSDYKNEMFNDALNMHPLDYEEKYGKPYREGLVLSFRNDYDDVPDTVFDDIDKSDDDTAAEELEPEVNIDKVDEDHIDDDSIDTALVGEPFPDDDSLFMDAVKDDKDKIAPNKVEPLLYANDAFVDDEKNFVPKSEENLSEEAKDDSEIEETVAISKMSVKDLSSSQLEDLTEQFSALHKDELDTNSEDFDQHVAPVHITLNVDEPVVVTSPNYPNAYPTNNIIDWVFDGEGTGIELNITDFAVNSALGDYLLVKPGGLDETGHEGLVFAYRLNSEKRYRFMDVDRMFVRFESKPGMAFLRGFQFSVKMISPLPKEPEPMPEPEPVVNPPTESLTLNLGGVTLAQFREIQEQFRLVIAEMASQYISDNNIEPGVNATVDITQITSTSLCNIHWPESENCAEVTFGVPLWYEDEELEPRLNEEDLLTMWSTYNNRDPFALRLESLGITEFSMPNDRSVLTVWVLIAGGVVIGMALLTAALWRYSCSENYTRMKSHSDVDSLHNEKRGLDLYPTPHQTLPPLYKENEYNWSDDKFDDSTRVDMGGFANKSYVRDELFDFDSDEDVITPRDSNNSTIEKDFIKNV